MISKLLFLKAFSQSFEILLLDLAFSLGSNKLKLCLGLDFSFDTTVSPSPQGECKSPLRNLLRCIAETLKGVRWQQPTGFTLLAFPLRYPPWPRVQRTEKCCSGGLKQKFSLFVYLMFNVFYSWNGNLDNWFFFPNIFRRYTFPLELL